MKLQLLLATICLTLYDMGYCGFGSGSREKRGLSEVQKRNLVDALNKDRQEIGRKIGVQMKTLVYDAELEKRINTTSPQFCNKRFKLHMKWDSVGQEFYDAVEKRNLRVGRPRLEQSRLFFWPENTNVACSNTFHCSREFDYGSFYNFPEMIGKTVKFYGKCVIHGEGSSESEVSRKLEKVDLPPISKYADIIGV